jgi:hypothetical protein
MADQQYVDDKIVEFVNSSPEALSTLNALSSALGDDENFATNVLNNIATKEEKYEIWNDITLTEDTASIYLTAKDNGESYQGFSKMKIAIFGNFVNEDLPAVTTRLRGALLEPSGGTYFLWGPKTNYTYNSTIKGQAMYIVFERISNNVFKSDTAGALVNNSSADATAGNYHYILFNRKKPADYYFNPTGFNIFTAETPTNFLAGTNIKVWGVKE